MTPTAPNPYRTAKLSVTGAMAICVQIGKLGLSVEQVAAMTEGQWSTLASIAGVNPPGEETRAVVLDSIRRQQR